MRGIGTGINSVISQNRMRAVSRVVVQGGRAGEELARSANKMAVTTRSGSKALSGVIKPKFILGLHPIDTSGRYVIP